MSPGLVLIALGALALLVDGKPGDEEKKRAPRKPLSERAAERKAAKAEVEPKKDPPPPADPPKKPEPNEPTP